MDAVIDLRLAARRYENGFLALSDVSLTIERSEFVAVTGPSGSGKTTLLNILGLLDVATSGSYLISGADVSGLGARQRARLRSDKLGFVFQAAHLLPDRTSLENVMIGWDSVDSTYGQKRNRSEQVLEEVGLAHRKDSLPATLSAGEAQRVAIARAVVKRPDIILCDEPTGNLDSGTAASTIDVLTECARRNACLVLVTHNLALAASADRRVALCDGRLV